ncbi:choline dehydrogenase [Dyella mobilis]|nr:GMC family oxidoreductase [Dyella mobilis]GLQ99342.1 choline dehydrogenase [Dyella mobilis]
MTATSTFIAGQQTFDYIVCGSGSSGSVVAARLAESGARSVLVIEAGGSDAVAGVSDPNLWPMNLGGDLDWNFATQREAPLSGRSIPFNMGKVLGGGSSINVGTWSRGHLADWNFFAEESGEAAWRYAEVLRLYVEKIESWRGPADALRGSAGAMLVNPVTKLHPFAEAVLDSAQSVGIKRFSNANGLMMEASEGCSAIDEIVADGVRQSVYRRYLAPLAERKNLTVLAHTVVHRLLRERDRVVGVECFVNGRYEAFRANERVILSLGAINTPRVLLQSGIGAASKLERLDIPMAVDLPAVGENLHDHIGFSCVWGGTQAELPAAPRSQVCCFWKTDASLDSPNAYTYATSGAWLTPENAADHPVPASAWSLVVGARLKGRGSVELAGPGLDAGVQIKSGYLSESSDIDTVLSVAERAIAMGNQASMASFSSGPVAPSVSTRAKLEDYLRKGLTTFWHQSGTARMGKDAGTSVVDGRLSVHGLDGLTIADASVFPRVTSGNTMAPCVVVGEMAAKFLLDT